MECGCWHNGKRLVVCDAHVRENAECCELDAMTADRDHWQARAEAAERDRDVFQAQRDAFCDMHNRISAARDAAEARAEAAEAVIVEYVEARAAWDTYDDSPYPTEPLLDAASRERLARYAVLDFGRALIAKEAGER